ncbi:hypothetical protein QQ056_13245 [Oscillatoria laete-virens NRMC-F 0139]|nr:hypothetical protein [Oscillatoria laete-virens]MDL5054504.1 hypothetical protein [Oscillatoria laete-virens NRMC-F 0139]
MKFIALAFVVAIGSLIVGCSSTQQSSGGYGSGPAIHEMRGGK